MVVYRGIEQFVKNDLASLLAAGKKVVGELEALFVCPRGIPGFPRGSVRISKPGLTAAVHGDEVANLTEEMLINEGYPINYKHPRLVFVYASLGNLSRTNEFYMRMKQKYNATVVVVICPCNLENKMKLCEKYDFEHVIVDEVNCGGSLSLRAIIQAAIAQW